MRNTTPARLLWCATNRFAVITVHAVRDAAGAVFEVAIESWGGLVRVAARFRTQARAAEVFDVVVGAGRFGDAANFLALSEGAR